MGSDIFLTRMKSFKPALVSLIIPLALNPLLLMSLCPWNFLRIFHNVMFQRTSAPLIFLFITFPTIITYCLITTIICHFSSFEMFPNIRICLTIFPLFCGFFRGIRVLSFNWSINLLWVSRFNPGPMLNYNKISISAILAL
jgi:hypothetical protein